MIPCRLINSQVRSQRQVVLQTLVKDLRMKTAVIVCLLVAVASTVAKPGDLYTDRYDSIDIDEIIGSHRLIVPYIHCLLDKGKCTAEGKELKSHIREALENNCAKCTPIQKSRTRQMIGHLINHEPAFWDELCQKYDPTQKFTKLYEAELRTIA